MRAMTFGGLGALVLLAACATEREGVDERAERLRDETREAGQELGREAEEAAKEVKQAGTKLLDAIKEKEKTGEAVEVDATLTGYDTDTVMLVLADGSTMEIDYPETARFRSGDQTIKVADIGPASKVRVTYALVDGKRVLQELEVVEPPPSGTR